MDSEGISIFSDGGARGNPGPAAAAFVVVDRSGRVLHKESKFLGDTTNNVAEYRGVVLAITWLLQEFPIPNFQFPIIFNLDSELVVRQLTGVYKVKDVDLKKSFQVVRNLQGKIKSKIIFKHIPRFKNKLADFLVNQELDRNP